MLVHLCCSVRESTNSFAWKGEQLRKVSFICDKNRSFTNYWAYFTFNIHKQSCVIYSLVQNIRSVFVSTEGLASFTPNSIPSNVLATVRSWISGLSGSRLLSSLFIRARVSRQFSLMISSWQSLISSSTRTLFLPPRGLPWILPSLM